MTTVCSYRPGSDEYEAALDGRVLAERISAVLAKPNTKAHREYLRVVRDGEHGKGDEYRHSEDRWRMIGRALRHYRDRDDTKVRAGLIYLHDEHPLACCPHGVDSDCIGLTVRLRETLETYDGAVAQAVDGLPAADIRLAQASMAVTGLRFWSILQYTEAGGTPELSDFTVEWDPRRGEELLQRMIEFGRIAGLEAAA